jgi:hypothetical protein
LFAASKSADRYVIAGGIDRDYAAAHTATIRMEKLIPRRTKTATAPIVEVGICAVETLLQQTF